MADWFETRFREPVDGGTLDPAFAARVRARVVEEWQTDAGSTPSDDIGADDQEGDIIMLETDHPTTGNEPASPRRRSRGRWLLVAAAVALVAIVGSLAAARVDDDNKKIDTATSVPTSPKPAQDIMDVADFGVLEPGTYFIDPDGDDSTPLRVTYEVAAEGWSSWIGAVKFRTAGHVSLSITTVDNLVREGCNDHSPAEPAVGPTVDDLVTALSALAPFEVSSPPRDVTILGYQGEHLELTVPQLRATRDNFTDCTAGQLHSWIARNNDGSFYGYNAEPGRTEQFWILDVDGTRLVLETTQSPDSPPQDLAERDAIFDSIRIES